MNPPNRAGLLIIGPNEVAIRCKTPEIVLRDIVMARLPHRESIVLTDSGSAAPHLCPARCSEPVRPLKPRVSDDAAVLDLPVPEG